MKLIYFVFIIVELLSLTYLKAEDSEADRIAFCQELLDSPENFIEKLQQSQYYDSGSFLIYYKELEEFNEFLVTYKNVKKLCISSNFTEYPIWQIFKDKKINIVSFYYEGVDNGIEFYYTKDGINYKLSKLDFNGIESEYQLNMFYNKISDIFKELQMYPDSFNDIIEKNELFCRYGNSKEKSRFYKHQSIDPLRVEILKKNRNNIFSILEVSKGWTSSKPQLWTDIELTFENSNDKINMQVTYYDCLPCIWQMEFDDP